MQPRFGSTTNWNALCAGDTKWPRCTLAYAPPDIVCAAKGDYEVRMSGAQDVWALGMMAYEAVVGCVTFTSLEAIGGCAFGEAPYPWERPLSAQPAAWRRSRLRALVMPCLTRDPDERPAASDLLAGVSRLGHTTRAQE